MGAKNRFFLCIYTEGNLFCGIIFLFQSIPKKKLVLLQQKRRLNLNMEKNESKLQDWKLVYINSYYFLQLQLVRM